MDGAPAVTVVIPTRRRPELLPQSVVAVLAQDTTVPYEVIVVNDDDEPLRCRLPDDPRLHVLASGGRGPAAARNVGISAARSEIVAFTDDDTVAPPNWVDVLYRALRERADAVGVEGPVDCGADVDLLYELVPTGEFPGGYTGCNVAYRRDALVAVGLFDERFRHAGAEDVDLGLRVAALGPVLAEPAMRMVHPPRPANLGALLNRGRSVENEWLLHANHPELSGRPRPLRFASLGWRTRSCVRMLSDVEAIQGSPRRMIRLVAVAVGTLLVALGTSLTKPMPGRTS